MKRFLTGLPILLCLAAFGGQALAAGPTDPLKKKIVAKILRQTIENDQPVLGTADNSESLIPIFLLYQERHYTPIWVRDTGPKTKARDFLKILKNSAADALQPSDYRVREIEKRITATDHRKLMELELLLSRAALDYGRDLHGGRVEPSKISADVRVYPNSRTPDVLLDQVSEARKVGPVMAGLAPRTPRYARIKRKLAEYRQLAATGGWGLVPEGETLKPEMSSDRIPAIRKLLIRLGDLPGEGQVKSDGGDPNFYDPVLVEGVKRFQYRHGIAQDSVIGRQTLEQMRVPVSVRVRQLELNMERRRWMQDNLGKFYIFVNLADQNLKVVKVVNDVEKTIHVAPVVVGKPFFRTPVFSKAMTYMVVNPFWNVPQSISVKELLPQLQKNPGAMQRQNIRIFQGWGANASEVDPFQVDWSRISSRNFSYRLRQDSGDRNALGRIKFMFPNKFNVYIHDTPSKRLFAKARRFFSHGCIRVQNPRGLAEVLLRETGSNLDRKDIDRLIGKGERRIIRLKSKIPVHLTYLTAWVNKDMRVHFRKDVYGRDKLLDAALKRSRLASTSK